MTDLKKLQLSYDVKLTKRVWAVKRLFRQNLTQPKGPPKMNYTGSRIKDEISIPLRKLNKFFNLIHLSHDCVYKTSRIVLFIPAAGFCLLISYDLVSANY